MEREREELGSLGLADRRTAGSTLELAPTHQAK